jgi:hypothetical protein
VRTRACDSTRVNRLRRLLSNMQCPRDPLIVMCVTHPCPRPPCVESFAPRRSLATMASMRPLSIRRHGLRYLLLVSVYLALPFSASIQAQTNASLGVALNAFAETHGDGSFSVTYAIRAVNLGPSDVRDVRLEGDLASAFSEASAFEVVSVASERGTVRADYDGRENRSLLSGTDSLAVGEAIVVTLVVHVTIGEVPLACANSVLGTGLAPDGSLLTDVSQQGIDPDPDVDADPGNNSAPTVVVLDPRPLIGLAKAASVGRQESDAFSITYTFTVRNLGQVTLGAVDVQDDLGLAFPAPAVVRIAELRSPDFDVNPLYDGANDVRLLTGADVLQPGAQGTLLLSLVVSPNGGGAWFQNRATARGNGPTGATVVDLSHEGTEPDPDGDGEAAQHKALTEVLLADVSTSGSFESTVRIASAPLVVDITSVVFDSSIQIDDFSARCTARFTNTNFDLLTFSALGTLGTSHLSSSLVFNPTTVSFVSWQTTGTLDVLDVRFADTLYIAASQSSSYTLFRASGETGSFALDASAKFGVCPVAFWEASVCADWTWPVCSIPLRACLAIDDSAGFVSFTASANSIPVLPGVVGNSTVLDVSIKYTTTEKVVTPTLRFQPQWLVCPEIRVFGELVFDQASLGIEGVSIYGLRVEVPVGDLIFRMADSLDPSKNSTLTGKAAYFELLEIEGSLAACCGTPGKIKISTYFEHPQVPTGTLFNVGLIVGYVELPLGGHVTTAVTTEFSPSTAPHWLLSAQLRVTW